MPKKKEPTKTTVNKEFNKTATQPAAMKPTVVEPTKPAEAAKPAPAPAPAAEKPAAPAPVKAAEKPAAPAPAPAKAAEKPAAPAPAKAAEKPAAPAPAKAEKPAAAKAAKSAARPESVVTVVVAKYDVGYGNHLFIRGEGVGLNWETGVLMKNVENDVWVWTTNEAVENPVAFKFLINDEIWATGDNQSAPAGETTTLYPSF